MRLFLLAVIHLAGCSAVVPSGMAQLSALSPMEAEPADIAMALELPQGIAVTPGSAKISFEVKRTDTGETLKETFILANKSAPNGVVIYQVAPADYSRLKASQQTAKRWKSEAGKSGSGSLSVGFGACALDDGPARDAKVSVNMRTKQGAAFFPLLRDAPLEQVLEVTELADLRPCP